SLRQLPGVRSDRMNTPTWSGRFSRISLLGSAGRSPARTWQCPGTDSGVLSLVRNPDQLGLSHDAYSRHCLLNQFQPERGHVGVMQAKGLKLGQAGLRCGIGAAQGAGGPTVTTGGIADVKQNLGMSLFFAISPDLGEATVRSVDRSLIPTVAASSR